MTTDKSEIEIKISPNPVIRWIFLAGGILLTAIGILGIFLPLLPTTIFLLLAAWCFARSSERFYNWLHNNRLFGKYLSNYRKGNGMTIRSKIFSLSLLWIGLGYSAIFATGVLYVRILLLVIGIGVSWHLIAIKIYKGPD